MVVGRGYAGACDVLVINAQRLFQQAHGADRRLAGAHLGPLLGPDLHSPFKRALVADDCRRVVKPQQGVGLRISALETNEHRCDAAQSSHDRRLKFHRIRWNDGLLRKHCS